MRIKLVVGNWKMNGGLATNARLLDRLVSEWQPSDARAVAVCVPYPYLGQAQAALASSAIAWGAQDVSANAAGAFTGDVSAGMLVEFGCRYAIVGHSERRQIHAEGDVEVAQKLLPDDLHVAAGDQVGSTGVLTGLLACLPPVPARGLQRSQVLLRAHLAFAGRRRLPVAPTPPR